MPAPLRVVIYRRLMLRIAERLARGKARARWSPASPSARSRRRRSRTSSPIGTAATLPVFRPLIGMDKEEVIADAHRIGTYAISIVPDEDCCQLFTPSNPPRARPCESVDAAEASLPLAELIDMAVHGASVEDFKFPVVQSTARIAVRRQIRRHVARPKDIMVFAVR